MTKQQICKADTAARVSPIGSNRSNHSTAILGETYVIYFKMQVVKCNILTSCNEYLILDTFQMTLIELFLYKMRVSVLPALLTCTL
jgi:hypothetical protein